MDLQELLDRQGGVVTREQALRSGVSARQLRTGGRRLQRIRPGVFAPVGVLADASPAARVGLQVAAAQLTSSVGLVAVGATAALLHGLPLLGPAPRRLQLAERKEVRPQHRGASRTLVVEDVVLVHGVPATSLVRTALDVARTRGSTAGVIAADQVLARGIPSVALDAGLAGCRGWPGSRAARRTVAFADGRSESALESLGRVRFAEQGLSAPALQVWLGDEDDRFVRVDHYWAEHRTVAEADGALKYASAADVWAEKRREDRLRDAGEEVVRYTWGDALRRPELLAARVLQAFTRSARRRGA